MSDTVTSSTTASLWFWIVAVFALLWNLMGVMAFVMQMMISPEVLSAMPEAERALIQAMPVGALLAFAIAVFAAPLAVSPCYCASAGPEH